MVLYEIWWLRMPVEHAVYGNCVSLTTIKQPKILQKDIITSHSSRTF